MKHRSDGKTRRAFVRYSAVCLLLSRERLVMDERRGADRCATTLRRSVYVGCIEEGRGKVYVLKARMCASE